MWQQLPPLWNSIVDLLFPPQCVFCQKSGFPICPYCSQLAKPPIEPLCRRCGRMCRVECDTCDLCLRMDDWSLTWVRAATLYTGPIAAAVQGLKYDGQRELARFLARYLVAAFQRPPWVHLMAGSNRMLDVVVPVPLHRKRFQERGYNQAGLVAQAFAPLVHLRSSSSVLTREHFSQSQVELQFDERQTNVKDAFRVTQDVKGKRVLLIDDVYTTGATLNECAKTLRLAGAREVYGLTIAMPTTTNSFLANS